MVKGLQTNGLLQLYSHVITGYIGELCCLQRVSAFLQDIKGVRNDDVFYLCDPVLGDEDRLYVPETLVPYYRNYLCPIADLVTPNNFEAQILSGVKRIDSIQSASSASLKMHGLGVPRIVITSAPLSDSECFLYGSVARLLPEKLEQGEERFKVLESTQFYITFPKIDCHFTGTGDLFAALLMCHLKDVKHSNRGTVGQIDAENLQRACERALTSTQGVLKVAKGEGGKLDGSKQRLELPIVQCKSILEQNSSTFKAVCLEGAFAFADLVNTADAAL